MQLKLKISELRHSLSKQRQQQQGGGLSSGTTLPSSAPSLSGGVVGGQNTNTISSSAREGLRGFAQTGVLGSGTAPGGVRSASPPTLAGRLSCAQTGASVQSSANTTSTSSLAQSELSSSSSQSLLRPQQKASESGESIPGDSAVEEKDPSPAPSVAQNTCDGEESSVPAVDTTTVSQTTSSNTTNNKCADNSAGSSSTEEEERAHGSSRDATPFTSEDDASPVKPHSPSSRGVGDIEAEMEVETDDHLSETDGEVAPTEEVELTGLDVGEGDAHNTHTEAAVSVSLGDDATEESHSGTPQRVGATEARTEGVSGAGLSTPGMGVSVCVDALW